MYAFRHVDFYFLNILLSIPRFIWQVNIKLVFDLNNAQKNIDLIYGMNIFTTTYRKQSSDHGPQAVCSKGWQYIVELSKQYFTLL